MYRYRYKKKCNTLLPEDMVIIGLFSLVDGYAFHRAGTRQAERDVLKDAVLAKCGLTVLRLSTVGSDERRRIRKKLEDVVA